MADVEIDPELEQEMEIGVAQEAFLELKLQSPLMGVSQLAASSQLPSSLLPSQ